LSLFSLSTTVGNINLDKKDVKGNQKLLIVAKTPQKLQRACPKNPENHADLSSHVKRGS